MSGMNGGFISRIFCISMLHFSNHLSPKNVHRYEPLDLIHVSVRKWRPDDIPIPKPDTSFDNHCYSAYCLPLQKIAESRGWPHGIQQTLNCLTRTIFFLYLFPDLCYSRPCFSSAFLSYVNPNVSITLDKAMNFLSFSSHPLRGWLPTKPRLAPVTVTVLSHNELHRKRRRKLMFFLNGKKKSCWNQNIYHES